MMCRLKVCRNFHEKHLRNDKDERVQRCYIKHGTENNYINHGLSVNRRNYQLTDVTYLARKRTGNFS